MYVFIGVFFAIGVFTSRQRGGFGPARLRKDKIFYFKMFELIKDDYFILFFRKKDDY